MYGPERYEIILRRLGDHRRIAVSSLATELNVTPETIRRDLTTLENQGRLRRVHGGAVPMTSHSLTEDTLALRQESNAEAKARIARATLALIPGAFDGAVMLDAGTTTAVVAQVLLERLGEDPGKSPMFVTNAAPIAARIAAHGGASLYVIGGHVRSVTGATVGAEAVAQVCHMRPDIAIIGTNGVDSQAGFTTPDPEEASIKSAMVRSASRVIVVTDASKIGIRTLLSFATFDEIDALVIDQAPPEPLAAALASAGVESVIA